MKPVTSWNIAIGDRQQATLNLEAPTISVGTPNIIVGVCVGTADDGSDAHWIGEAPVSGAGPLSRTISGDDLKADPVRYVEARYLIQLPVGPACTLAVKGTLTMGSNSETLDNGLQIQNGGSSGGYLPLTWWIKS